MVAVEPCFFALTTTPSIAPSSTEVTTPVNAAGGPLCARTLVEPDCQSRTVRAAVANEKLLVRIVISLGDCGLERVEFASAGASIARGTRPSSVQRLELDDRGAVVGADPERYRRGRIVDEHAADVGRARQQVFDHLAGLGVEPRDLVGNHRAGPGLVVLVDRDIVGR